MTMLSLIAAALFPAHAQLSAGGGIAGHVAYYDIVSTDGKDAWLGQVVVVGAAATEAPVGMKAGTET